MNELQALLLGIVQGLTEFLPISSSGHLILVPWVMDFEYLKENPDFNKTFDVALHAGTLVAVVSYFRRDIAGLLRGGVSSLRHRRISNSEERLAWMIALATVPAVVVGGLGANFIEDELGEPWQIAIQLVVFGALLWLADRMPQKKEMRGLGWGQSFGIGVAQAISLIPGTSRSGVTITAGRFFGLTRDSAARFSFLMLAPAVFGATVFTGAEVVREGLPPGSVGPMIVGMVAAALSGFAAIAILLRYLRTHDYMIFVWYRFVAAGVVVALIASGALPPDF